MTPTSPPEQQKSVTVIYPKEVAIFGVWLGDCWLLLAGVEGSGVTDMPHCFFTKADAEDWIFFNPDFSNGLIVPLNNTAREALK